MQCKVSIGEVPQKEFKTLTKVTPLVPVVVKHKGVGGTRVAMKVPGNVGNSYIYFRENGDITWATDLSAVDYIVLEGISASVTLEV